MGDNQFRAAAYAVNITPDISRHKVRLHGYGARGSKPAEGVHDPIYAKILVLDNGRSRAAIITMDILQIDSTMREDVVRRAGIPGLSNDTVVMTATHSHSAPAALEPRTQSAPSGLKWYVEAYYEECASAIAAGLKDASSRLTAARFACKRMNLPGAVRNRRVPGYSYETRAFSTPAEKGEVVDDELAVLHFVRGDDTVIATLVNLAAHGTVLGSDNMLVSADWPGALQHSLEEQLGGICLFANGAQGNVAPDCGGGVLGFKDAEDFGELIASHIVDMVQEMTPSSPQIFATHSAKVALPAIILTDDNPYIQAGLSKDFLLDLIRKVYPRNVQMTSIRLGDTGMVTIPGEMLTELSVDFKKQAASRGIETALILGLANDALGYIPSPGEYAKGGYEAEMCFYGPTLGTKLIDAALAGLTTLFT